MKPIKVSIETLAALYGAALEIKDEAARVRTLERIGKAIALHGFTLDQIKAHIEENNP